MWEEHPKFVLALEELSSQLKRSNSENLTTRRKRLFGSSTLPRILFICGGDQKYCKNRGIIESYLRKYSTNIFTFRAEYAWDVMVNSKKNVNALALEEWLADFSDAVIILVESYGTVAELGAFSMSDSLRRKLLPILDKRYSKDPSFINTGPVRWVDNDSVYKPCIYTDFNSILKIMPEIVNRIDTQRPKFYVDRDDKEKTFGNLNLSRKELLLFILMIIISIGPVNEDIIISQCKTILEIKSKKDINEIEFIISLSVALEMAKTKIINDKCYYFPNNIENIGNNDSIVSIIKSCQRIRARCLSHLVYIESYTKTLENL